MPSRRFLLGILSLLFAPFSGCLGRNSPTRICSVQLLNWDRERHHFHVQIVADETTLWERTTSVPGRTDDVVPGPEYDSGLPTQQPVFTIRAKIDDSEWTAETFGKDHDAVELHIHAEDGSPGIWFSADCPATTATPAG